MPVFRSTALSFALTLAACLPLPATAASEPVYQVMKLSDTLYELRAEDSGIIVKVLASVGPDGVLLVESGEKQMVPALLKTLKRLGGGAPRIVINSHSHQEHWDGNRALGPAPVYIAHENYRKALRSNRNLYLELDQRILPQVTVNDSLTLHFNGEEIRIESFAGAHDDSDLVIWFTRSKVAFVGALVTAMKLPTVDGLRGDIRRYPEVTRKVLEYLPAEVKLVPGHGEDANHAQGERFLEMLEKTAALVQRGIAEGKTLEALDQEDLLGDWSSWETSYSNRAYWLSALYDGYTGKAAAFAAKKTIHEPLHAVLRAKGPDAVPAAYDDLKARFPEYRFDERSLLVISGTLLEEGKHREAIPFLELLLRDFPQGRHVARTRENLGDAYRATRQKARAAEYYRAALELEPQNAKLEAKLKALRD